MRDDTKEMILIVDDTPTSINIVETVLAEAGYQVSVATSGEKALDRLSIIIPDLILLDIMMPGIDGYETCRRLREKESTRSIPIIFLSALAETFDKVKGFDLGAVDYLIKPIASEELLARVRTHLKIKKLEKGLEHQNSLLLSEITEKRKAEEALQRANEELESRVMERTADLQATNEELLSEMEVRKQAEEELRGTCQILGAVLNSITFRVFWKDQNSIYLGCNMQFARDAGYEKPADIIGKDDYAMGWREQADLYRNDDQMVIESGRPKLLFEEPQTTPSGEKIYLLTSKVPLQDGKGEIIGVLGTYLDITERKKAEEAVIKSEMKYRTLYEESFDGLFITAPEGKILDMNRKGISMFGYDTKEEILSLDLERDVYAYPPDRKRILSKVNEHGSAEYEVVVKKKDGERMHTYCSLTAVKDETGVITSYRGIIRDITERKKTEKALQESEEMYRSVVNAMAEGSSLMAVYGEIIAVNSAAEQITGRTAEQLVGRTYADLEWSAIHEDGSLFPGKDHPSMIALCSGQPQSNVVMGIHRPDGILRWISVNSEPLIAAGETKPYAVISTFHDFTDRKRAEEAVHVAIKLNHLISTMTLNECMNFTLDEAERLTTSNIGFFHFINPDEKSIQLVTWSKETRKHCFIPKEPDQNYPVSKGGVWVDCLRERKPVIHNDYASLPNKKGLPDGHVPGIRELVVPIFDEDKIVAIIGVGNKATDYDEKDINVITLLAENAWILIKRKQVEEEIRKSEEQFRILADYTYDWEYWINPDRRFVYTTPSCSRITGYTAEDFLIEPNLLERIIHPDDLSIINNHFFQSDLTFEISSLDFRIISKNGDVRWINHICEPIFDENGTFLGRRVTNRDITKRKYAEEALVVSEEKYRTLVENIRIGVYQSKADEIGSFIWVNQAMVTLFGYNSAEEFLQIHAIDLYVNPEERTKYLKIILKDGFVRNFEIKMKKNDGTEIWVSVTSYIRYASDGSVLWIDGFLEDISEHYQIEELKWKAFHQIEKNIEQFSILNDQIRNPLSIILTVISDGSIPQQDVIEKQIMRIDSLVDQLDKGYLESEKVSLYLRKHQPEIFLKGRKSDEE